MGDHKPDSVSLSAILEELDHLPGYFDLSIGSGKLKGSHASPEAEALWEKMAFDLKLKDLSACKEPEQASFNSTSSFRATAFSSLFQQGCETEDGRKIVQEEYPHISQITPDVVAYWERRGKDAAHPVLVARYCDLVNELTLPVRCTRPAYRWALMAADSYLAACRLPGGREFSKLPLVLRALQIYLSLGKESAGAVSLVRELIERTENPHFLSRAYFGMAARFSRFLPEVEEVAHQNAEKIISGLKKTAPDASLGHCDACGDVLESIYRRQGSRGRDDLKALLLDFWDLVDKNRTFVSEHQRALWMGKAVRRLSRNHFREEAKKFTNLLKKQGITAQSELRPIKYTVRVTKEELMAMCDGLGGRTKVETLLNFARQFVPRLEDIDQIVRELREKAPLIYLLPKHQVGDGLPRANVGGIDDKEGNRRFIYNDRLRMATFIGVLSVNELAKRKTLTRAAVLKALRSSPVWVPERQNLIECAVRHFVDGEWTEFISVAIPQLEFLLRQTLDIVGEPLEILKERTGVYEDRTLGEILSCDKVKKLLSADVAYFLSAVLTEKWGVNLRNRHAHGLLGSHDYNNGVAVLIFVALLCLGAIGQWGSEEQRSNPSSE